jgi:hypothetical protein
MILNFLFTVAGPSIPDMSKGMIQRKCSPDPPGDMGLMTLSNIYSYETTEEAKTHTGF